MRSPVVLGLLAASLASGCGSPAGDPLPKPFRVRVAAAAARDFEVTIRLSGRIAPPVDRQASVSASIAGRLLDVTAREGQRVQKGGVLARIDARSLEDAVRSGEAALRRVQADRAFKHDVARRSRELFDRGVASRQEAESDESGAVAADASVVEATANVEAARRNRGFADVITPFDGVVVRVLRHPGELVDGSAGTPIVEIAGLHPLEIALDAPPEVLSRLSVGDTAEVSQPSGKALPASVVRIAAALDAASVVGGVRLRFTGSDPALLLGSPVEVALTLERLKDAVSVPKRAVRRGPEGGAEVVLAVDGRAKVTPVVTGPESGDSIVIREGLEVGQVVVIEDPLGLADGTALEVER